MVNEWQFSKLELASVRRTAHLSRVNRSVSRQLGNWKVGFANLNLKTRETKKTSTRTLAAVLSTIAGNPIAIAKVSDATDPRRIGG